MCQRWLFMSDKEEKSYFAKSWMIGQIVYKNIFELATTFEKLSSIDHKII
jgi:hypothetical protein